ncbi:maestro heat-like repeat-containing protein family member 7 [Agelaius phoeniceus]|uniref:maestro heat-like repeat-containing protein family member 7 n=1 Tax=Agelaius phoeniceus TaxID=39638 RepID=UPI004054B285
MASCLFDLLSQGISDWELPALAFLVEVLDCLDLSECGKKVLEILTRHLQSESRQMRGVALRGLVVLTSMDPSMYSLTESLGKLLWDRDEDIVEKTLIVLSLLLLQKDLAIASPIALQLAEALWHLFDNDNSLVQLLSIRLFQDVITLVVAKGEKALKKHVSQSLLPLFFHCHDENGRVAQASRETLLSAVSFLKRKDLKQLLQTDQMWRFAECLLAEDRSRAAEQLRLALPYVRSAQEPLREAAVRFMGMAGRFLTGQQPHFRIICRGECGPRALAGGCRWHLRSLARPPTAPLPARPKVPTAQTPCRRLGDIPGQQLPARPSCLLLPPGRARSCVLCTSLEALPSSPQIQPLTGPLFLSLQPFRT